MDSSTLESAGVYPNRAADENPIIGRLFVGTHTFGPIDTSRGDLS